MDCEGKVDKRDISSSPTSSSQLLNNLLILLAHWLRLWSVPMRLIRKAVGSLNRSILNVWRPNQVVIIMKFLGRDSSPWGKLSQPSFQLIFCCLFLDKGFG